MGLLERKSADGEYFTKVINNLHEQGKLKFQENNQRYKHKEVLERREVQFNVGDLVLAHLRKERFPKGEYNKLKWKRIGPCRIFQMFCANAYELWLPPGIGISPIFNVADLCPYIAVDEEDSSERRT